MTRRAFVLGGTGQIGRAVARRLDEGGWEVTVGARRPRPDLLPFARFFELDRERALAPPGEFDALVDVIAMSRADAEQLLALAGRVGTVVAISSASVYADGAGRTLDEATDEATFPRFPDPIPETQPTVEPGETTYSSRKVAMERTLLQQDALPVTIVRPCAVYGPGSELPRELFFVKRVLDGRRVVLLSHRGESRFHTTSVQNLAEVVALAVDSPATRVLNCGDPAPPTVLEIGRAVCRVLGAQPAECLLAGAAALGRNPWGVPAPLVVDMAAAARELGYRPRVGYAEGVVETVRWLADERPEPEGYLAGFFDYAAEDAYLRELAAA